MSEIPYRAAADKPKMPKWLTVFGITLAVVVTLALLLFIYTGTFSRFIADDYCSADLLRNHSFWKAQWLSYTTWSNRYATMLVTGLIDPLDTVGIRLLPGVLILGLTAGLYWLLRRVTSHIRYPMPGIFLYVLAGLSVYFSLYTTPNLFQSYYWRSGNITYTMPAAGLIVLLAVLLSHTGRSRSWWQLILVGLFAFFLMGFSETNAALLIAVLFLGTGVSLLLRYRAGRQQVNQAAWVIALGGALAGLAAVYLAPGNAMRLEQMPDPPSFFEWLGLSFRYAYDYLFYGITSYIVPRTISFAFGLVLATQIDWTGIKPGRLGFALGIGLVFLFLLTAACVAPSVYAQHAYPEDRAMTSANILLSTAVIGAGFLVGILLRTLALKIRGVNPLCIRLAGAVLMAVFTLYVVYSGYQVAGRIDEYRQRAEQWDQRAEQIEQLRQAGDLNPHITALDSFYTVQEISGDPELWVNQCAAGYYELESITAE